mgnify:CR=1 FL=1
MIRIFLIGYMGAGKTTLGKAFARAMGLTFVDLDWYIEERFHKTVRQIFTERGEDGFRELEKRMLHEAGEFEDVVISVGGGTPCFFDNMEYMNQAGETVFLDESNALSLITGCDAVLDALDNIPSRKILSAACEKANIPYIYGAIQGWVAQAGISMPGDHLIDTLYPEEIEIRDKSVLSFTPALCASMQAALCVKLLTGRDVDTGKIYYFDLLNQEFETIPMV